MDQDKLNDFVGSFIGDLGATIAAGSIVVGHRLGLYRALAKGPATVEELAARTDCDPRYLSEWLHGQAAGGYVTCQPESEMYWLTEEQAFVLANPDGPLYAPEASSRRWEPSGRLTGSPKRSAADRGLAGTSTTKRSSSAPICSSGPDTSPIWYRVGSPRWTGSRTACAQARTWSTSAAGSARRRSSSHSTTPTRGSSVRTITPRRSTGHANGLRRPASLIESPSRWRARSPSPDRRTTWSRPLTAFTTWATR